VQLFWSAVVVKDVSSTRKLKVFIVWKGPVEHTNTHTHILYN